MNTVIEDIGKNAFIVNMVSNITNIRYIAYSKAHGKTPEEMIKYDSKQQGCRYMAGFILWIHSKLREFRKLKPDAFSNDYLYDQNSFTEFLNKE